MDRRNGLPDRSKHEFSSSGAQFSAQGSVGDEKSCTHLEYYTIFVGSAALRNGAWQRRARSICTLKPQERFCRHFVEMPPILGSSVSIVRTWMAKVRFPEISTTEHSHGHCFNGCITVDGDGLWCWQLRSVWRVVIHSRTIVPIFVLCATVALVGCTCLVILCFSVLLPAGVACIASASAFAPACLAPSTRSIARSGVTDLSMSAGTGKIKTVAAFRAGLQCLVSLAACLSSVPLSVCVHVVGSLSVTI